MNKQVTDSIKQVIKNWMTGVRNYTFETRGIKSVKTTPDSGEYIIAFYLKVNGFYTDQTLSHEIDFNFESPNFISQNISLKNPVNPDGDANNLRRMLKVFTADCYGKIVDEMKKYPEAYTTDFLYWK